MKKTLTRILGVALLAAAAAGTAWAGGPLYTYDAENKIPYAWHLDTWIGGAVPYYLDSGPLGRLSESVADARSISAFDEWNNVPSSNFLAQYAGKFSDMGIPDLDRTNAGLILSQWNGGGIDVIYDTDGGILEDWIGISRFSVLGLTTIEWAAPNSNEILEAWVILNGAQVSFTDPAGTSFRGVMTHEFGHSAGLAHTTTNGQVQQQGGNNDQPQARDCPAPWPTNGKPTANDIETMYPAIQVNSTGNGTAMSTVDRIDDIAAISDMYPALGWPESYGTIRGKIFTTDLPPERPKEVTGVNVIARNVANPFADAASYLSGQVSKGLAGPDGEFVLHGLTPGATYVIYVDNLQSGAFSVPRMLVLPGPEEYYNGPSEGGNGETDDRCAWTEIPAAAGTSTVADIYFNKVKGAPVFIPMPNLGIPTDINPGGTVVTGYAGTTAFRWNLADNSWANIGGYSTGASPAISDDGTKIAFVAQGSDGRYGPAIYENGSWTQLPLGPSFIAPCEEGPGVFTWGSPYDISGDGSTVVGLAYSNGCDPSNGSIRGFRYKDGVTTPLPKSPEAFASAARANGTNYDGTVIAGWDDSATGTRRGAYWTVSPDGTVSPVTVFTHSSASTIGEGLDLTADGSLLVGLNFVSGGVRAAYRYTVATGEFETFPVATARSVGFGATSGDGNVHTGWADFRQGFLNIRVPTIWTREMGLTDLNYFLNTQGTYNQDLVISNVTTLSGNGTKMAGFGNSAFGQAGFAIDSPKVVLCHKSPGSPNAKTTSIDVEFPDGLADHLVHGDTIGLCQHGGL